MKTIISCLALGVSLSWAMGITSCSGNKVEPSEERKNEVDEYGSMSMELKTTSASGKEYRLRNAILPIQSQFGGESIVLNSETNPNSSVLEAFLAPSPYFIELQEGWFMEQVDGLLGTSAFVEATLLSSSFQFFEIVSDEETFVRYDFEVNGERISFGRPGRVIVGIDVTERQASCGDGRLDPGEECDSFEFGGQTCGSVTMNALPFGFLQCTPFCTFDTSFCSGSGGGGTGGIGTGGAGTGGFGTDGGGSSGGTSSVDAGGPVIDSGPTPSDATPG